MKSLNNPPLFDPLRSQVKEKFLKPVDWIIRSNSEGSLDFVNVFSVSLCERVVVVEFEAHCGVVDDLKRKLENER